MATSGTWLFNPDLAELVDEAFERCRIDPAHITARHIQSARRSMRFMLTDWATRDYHEFRIQSESFTLVEGQAVYTAGVDFDIPVAPNTSSNLIELLDAVLTRSGVDTPVTPWSRSDYLNIPEKSIEGRPDRWFIDKQRDQIVVTFWPVPENSTDIITFNGVRKFEDADAAADNADISYYMQDAFAYGLAFRLAEKYAPPELESALFQKAEKAFRDAQNAVRERGDVRIVPVSASRRRRGSAGRYR
jgi:hypothetical protein